jgi:hypothetical protein
VGTTLGFGARALVPDGRVSQDAELTWTTDRPRVATVDRVGNVTAIAPGTALLTVKSGDASARHTLRVVPSPIAQLRISGGAEHARTGDVLRFKVEARNPAGRPVPGVVPLWSLSGVQIGDDLGARVWPDGGFVAEEPGLYTVVATVGPRSVRVTVKADPRRWAVRSSWSAGGCRPTIPPPRSMSGPAATGGTTPTSALMRPGSGPT